VVMGDGRALLGDARIPLRGMRRRRSHRVCVWAMRCGCLCLSTRARDALAEPDVEFDGIEGEELIMHEEEQIKGVL
jgi:hypothetical protein